MHLFVLFAVAISFVGLSYVFHSDDPSISPIMAAGCPGTTSITSNTSWTTNQCLGDVTVSNGATLTITGNTSHALVSLTLGDGATNGYINMNGDTTNDIGGTITTDGNIYIYSGSYISADGRGFTSNGGPGGGNASNAAGHGGMGGGASGPRAGDAGV